MGRFFLLIVLVCLPIKVLASDYTGVLSLLYVVLITPLFTFINLGLMTYFHSKKKYADKVFANRHVGFGIVIPAFGCLLSFSDHKTLEGFAITFGVNLVALLLALIPKRLHQK